MWTTPQKFTSPILNGKKNGDFNGFHVTKHDRDVRYAAHKFLRWKKDNYGSVEMWEKIIEGMKQLEKNNTIKELGFQERLVAAKRVKHVQKYNI